MKPSAIISFALLFAIMQLASGQRPVKQTVVLNDGTRLVGAIIGDSADVLLIKVKRPSVITFNKSAVSHYDTQKIVRKVSADRHGYYIRLSTSVLAGKNDYGNTGSLSFHFSNGFHFRNGLSAGVGFGLEELDVVVMPVYADFRFYPFSSRVSPFAYVKSGYGFPLGDEGNGGYLYGYYPEGKGGFVFNTGAGIAIYSWGGNAVNIGVGYRYQKLSFRQMDVWGMPTTAETITRFNRIELQFGFTFM